jgi:hypothetical protein
MLTVLRYLLLIVTAICFATLTYELWKDHRNAPWFAYCIWISLVLNFAYLTASVPNQASSHPPKPIRHASRHHGSSAQRLMGADKVVVEEVKRHYWPTTPILDHASIVQ